MIYVNIILLTIAVVFVVDISGWTDAWKGILSLLLTKGRVRKTDYTLKPFDCSLCSTWWCGLIYLLVVGSLSLKTIAFLAVMASMTRTIGDVWNCTLDALQWLISQIQKRL